MYGENIPRTVFLSGLYLEETRWVRIPSFCRPVCTFLQTACRPVCTFCRPLADRSALFADRLQTGRRLRLHCVRRCRCRRGGVAVAGRGRRSESGDVGPSGGAGILQTGEILSNRMIGAGVLSGPGPVLNRSRPPANFESNEVVSQTLKPPNKSGKRLGEGIVGSLGPVVGLDSGCWERGVRPPPTSR